ncbi:hypothetical protein DINM_006847 [Dirofilaria immitis]|nr:hypothetical protein [Dirofilaria immitis]
MFYIVLVYKTTTVARLAQSVEHQTLNLAVAGSSPASGLCVPDFSKICNSPARFLSISGFAHNSSDEFIVETTPDLSSSALCKKGRNVHICNRMYNLTHRIQNNSKVINHITTTHCTPKDFIFSGVASKYSTTPVDKGDSNG